MLMILTWKIKYLNSPYSAYHTVQTACIHLGILSFIISHKTPEHVFFVGLLWRRKFHTQSFEALLNVSSCRNSFSFSKFFDSTTRCKEGILNIIAAAHVLSRSNGIMISHSITYALASWIPLIASLQRFEQQVKLTLDKSHRSRFYLNRHINLNLWIVYII